jgi:PAS domain-containing protein
MPEEDRTRTDLLAELANLRQRVATLESEQSRTENRFWEYGEYAQSIIDCSLDMIITVDMDRQIIEFNQVAEKAFGYRRDEVLQGKLNLYNDQDAVAVIQFKPD